MTPYRERYEATIAERLKDVELYGMDGETIDYVLIAEPKGLYGANRCDGFDPYPIKAILQDVDTGAVVADTEFGLLLFDFDEVGTLACMEELQNSCGGG